MGFKSFVKINSGNIKYFIFSQIFVVVTIITIIALSFSIFYKNLKNNSITSSKNTIVEISDKIDNFFIKGTQLLESSADVTNHILKTNGSKKELLEYLVFVSNSDFKKNIGCISNGVYGLFNDTYIDGGLWVPDADYDPKTRDWYIYAKAAGGENTFVPPYIDAETGKLIISIAKLLPDQKSVIAIDLLIDEIQNLANQIITEQHNQVLVVDKFGYILASKFTNMQEKTNIMNKENSEEKVLFTKITSQQHGQFETKYYGRKTIVYSENVLNDLYVIVMLDKPNLIKSVIGKMSFIIIGMLLILLLTVLLCSVNFRQRYLVSKYAKFLDKNKQTLEHQLIDLWNQQDKKGHDLVKMQEAVIEGMATIIEYRDVNTGMHVQNTKTYVLMITNYLYKNGLHSDEVTEHFLNMVGNAAAMHDIGKISISDRILNKPGKLDKDEYEIMKTHTTIGAGLVRQVFGKSIEEDMLRMCIDVVQYHHERWDGTGYPIGLKGEDIPLAARIMAIADVFDAIASRRVYKDAVPADEVFEILKNNAGTQFDPELVDIFLSMKEDIVNYLISTSLNATESV